MESCYIAQSGFSANADLMQAITSTKYPVYCDNLVHLSFNAGISGKINKIIFKHNNPEDLEKKIRKNGPGIIVVESLYSVTGDLAPLKKYCEIKKQYDCMIIVDESHSLGLYGKNGRGIVFEQNLTDDVEFITASLAKAFSTRAGIVAGKKRHIMFLRERGAQAVFSSAVFQFGHGEIGHDLGFDQQS